MKMYKSELRDITKALASLTKITNAKKLSGISVDAKEEDDMVCLSFKNHETEILVPMEPILSEVESNEEFKELIQILSDSALEAFAKARIKNTEFDEIFDTKKMFEDGLKEFLALDKKLVLEDAYFFKYLRMIVMHPKALSDDSVIKNICGITIGYCLFNEKGEALSFITKTEMKQRHLTENIMYYVSIHNLLETSHVSFIDEDNDTCVDLMSKRPVYSKVSTNYTLSDDNFGAVAFLIPSILDKIADYLGEDFFFFVENSDIVHIHPKSKYTDNIMSGEINIYSSMAKNILYYEAKTETFSLSRFVV